MPVDAAGNVADFIMDGDSTVKRMNIGRMYEQYLNACSREVSSLVKRTMAQPDLTQAKIDELISYVLGYYEIVSPNMHSVLTGPDYRGSLQSHLEDICKNGIYLFLPTDNPVAYGDVIRELRFKYPPVFGPVHYKGASGQPCVTKNDVLIGSMYLMLLEKTGSDWSGVSSAKLQHFGVLAKLTNMDKNSAPGRQQPVRFLGESEVRLTSAFVDGRITSDLLDQSNNPAVHKEIVNNIIRADKPMRIERIIDREKHPKGNGRPIVFIRHMFECAGFSIKTPPSE